ncbi:hypothetical protein Pcinc_003598, partial [Petrolisthes cinctipes]
MHSCSEHDMYTLDTSWIQDASEKREMKNTSDEEEMKNSSDEKEMKNSSDENEMKNRSDEKEMKNCSDEKEMKNWSDEKEMKNNSDEKEMKNTSEEDEMQRESCLHTKEQISPRKEITEQLIECSENDIIHEEYSEKYTSVPNVGEGKESQKHTEDKLYNSRDSGCKLDSVSNRKTHRYYGTDSSTSNDKEEAMPTNSNGGKAAAITTHTQCKSQNETGVGYMMENEARDDVVVKDNTTTRTEKDTNMSQETTDQKHSKKDKQNDINRDQGVENEGVTKINNSKDGKSKNQQTENEKVTKINNRKDSKSEINRQKMRKTPDSRTTLHSAELSALEQKKRPSSHGLPLVFKILKTCCQPTLAPHDSQEWTPVNPQQQIQQQYYSCAGIEGLLCALMQTYHDQNNHTQGHHTITKEDYDKKVCELRDWLTELIEAGGRHDVTGRWKEQLDKILTNFDSLSDAG